MTSLDDPQLDLSMVRVEVTNPESPFGGVQVFGATDVPIQVILREGETGPPGEQGERGEPGDPGMDGPAGGVSEQGITPLVAGQALIDVVFGSVQENANWHLVECSVVNTIDPAPLNIWPGIITVKTASGFRIQLNGIPDTGNYYLSWGISGVNVPPVEATTYALSGPTSGVTGAASAVFTVALLPSTTVASPVTVTPDDGGAGGTFTPTSVMLTTEAPSGVFTYTPSADGVATIGTTNDGGLTDPADISFTASSYSTSYTLTGPSGGVEGVASTNFTVALPGGGSLASPVTVTPSDGGGGGTFTPTTVNLSTGAPSATFTYTPASAGAKTISVTNSGGLTNPANLTYTATAASTVHLLNTLISYWKLDEASGSRNDIHDANHLTDNNTVGSTTGKLNNAANFVAANSEYLSRASNSSLQVTGDFTFSCWVKLASTTSDQYLISKFGTAPATSGDYAIFYHNTAGWIFSVNDALTIAVAWGTPATAGVWYHLVAWWDSADSKLRIKLNDGATQVSSMTGALVQTSNPFLIGSRPDGLPGVFLNGDVDEVAFYKRKLNASEITALFGSGTPPAYSTFTL